MFQVEGQDKSSEIIKSLNQIDDNLPTKTDVRSPLDVSFLVTISEFLKANKLKKSAKILDDLVKNYESLMISHDRQGRKETIEALKGVIDRELTLSQRLLNNDNMNE
ncbi:MAG: hypothetical protein PHX34_05810 [Candidatus Shapirobacteria bacterium]|nr:hypothetical protein [Candidatus Shapirobacteria bacterium]